MDNFDQIFQHLPQHRIVICKTCQYAVIPSQIRGHLQRHHRATTSAVQQSIQNTIEQLSDIAEDHKDVVYPIKSIAPIGCLPVYTDGFQCLGRNPDGQ
jgi:uncharacterized protein (DUF2225 family)